MADCTTRSGLTSAASWRASFWDFQHLGLGGLNGLFVFPALIGAIVVGVIVDLVFHATLGIPWVYGVWRTRSVYLSIIVHVAVNMTSLLLLLALVLATL